jgi:DNA helicase HerA-like ATPase
MDLSEVQTEVLSVVFKIAKDNNLPLKTIGNLRTVLNFVSTNMEKLKNDYGGISELTMAALMRNVIHLEANGGEMFFGEPAFEITDWLQTNEQGEGMINVLQAVELIQNPLLYSTFLLWMLTKLYEVLAEVGDQDKPKIVFFFDEAHLLFRDASKVLLQKIEQVARLIRSKGVGVYFITQSPTDIPEIVLAQLGNKIQHALRAYTPKDQKMLKVVAESFRANPDFKTIEVLSELGTGEALISFLDKKGVPNVVERAWILPPQSLIGTVSEQAIREKIAADVLSQKYTAAQTKIDNRPLSETEKFLQQKQQSQAKPNVFEKSAQKVITNTASTMGRELGKKIIKSFFR